MALLDTTTLIDLSRPRRSKHFQAVSDLLRGFIGKGRAIYTSTINEAEFRVGGFLAQDPAAELLIIEDVLSTVVILEFDHTAAIRYAEIQAHLTKIGRRTGAADTFIAAVAVANAEPIVTRNPRDFTDVPGLTVISY